MVRRLPRSDPAQPVEDEEFDPEMRCSYTPTGTHTSIRSEDYQVIDYGMETSLFLGSCGDIEDRGSADQTEARDTQDARFLIDAMSSLVAEPILELQRKLKNFQHMGPLRSLPNVDRLSLRSVGHGVPGWFSGLAAWDVLLSDDPGPFDDVSPLKKTNQILNGTQWFNAGLKIERVTAKELPVTRTDGGERSIPNSADNKALFADFLNLSDAAIHSMNGMALASPLKAIRELAAGQRDRCRLVLTDTRSNTEVNPRDLGTGISRCCR
jgi:hypothetical protein